MAIDTRLAQRISRLYYLAVALIALLALLSQGFLQVYLFNLSFDSREVNLAGKMRMLSQRTVKIALLMERGDTSTDQRQQLAATTDELQTIFDGLANGNPSLALQPPNDEKLNTLFTHAKPLLTLTLDAANILISAPIADNAASAATRVLPEPTSPCTSRIIGRGCRISC